MFHVSLRFLLVDSLPPVRNRFRKMKTCGSKREIPVVVSALQLQTRERNLLASHISQWYWYYNLLLAVLMLPLHLSPTNHSQSSFLRISITGIVPSYVRLVAALPCISYTERIFPTLRTSTCASSFSKSYA